MATAYGASAMVSEEVPVIGLLVAVLPFFGSDLPRSKAAAESAAHLRWPQPGDAREEIEKLKNYFDDFCVEMGLIQLGLESYATTATTGSSGELVMATERLLKFLESILHENLAQYKNVR
jgi:hypothetical protein